MLRRVGTSRRSYLAVVAAGLVLCCSGHRPPSLDPADHRPGWPPPPAQARIEFVQMFHEPGDLGIRRNAVARFFRRLAGGRRQAEMVRPFAITVMPDGTIAVADPDARSVHLFDPGDKRYVRLADAGGEPLLSPVGLAADPQGRLYVADSARAGVFRFDSDGTWLDTFVPPGSLQRPTGLAFDAERQILYVVDTQAHRIVGFDPDGRRRVEIGRRGTAQGEFNYPVAVTVAPSGNLYVTDAMNFRVQILDPSGRFVDTFGEAGKGPGNLDKVKGIALDADGHVYLVEALHDVIQVFDGAGNLLTVIGGTGTGAGEFWLPSGIHIDDSGRIFVADSANRRVQILRYLGDGEGI